MWSPRQSPSQQVRSITMLAFCMMSMRRSKAGLALHTLALQKTCS